MIPVISTIPVVQLASGDRLSLQIYQFQGAVPGKKAYIQSNLHGAEISGNAVIHQLIEFLMSQDSNLLIGEILLVPVCNPVGVSQRSHHFSPGRYNHYDGADWNRIFWDFEKEGEDIEGFAKSHINLDADTIKFNYRKQIALSFAKQLAKINAPSCRPYSEIYRYKLQSLCLDADYVLDLHSSTNQAVDYVYCFSSREESAKAFLLDRGILMDEYDGDAFDEAFLKPWLALEKSLTQLGSAIGVFDVEAWTLELGSGMQMNPESVAKGLRGIKNYLASKGMLKIPGFPLPETAAHEINLTPKKSVKKYYAPAGGMIQNRVQLGSIVKKGHGLYQILSFHKNWELPSVVEVAAESDVFVFDVSTNQSVNQGEYVLSVMAD
ncbi:succinylglutamate desuccinylase/aspartoacylase family protein [Microcoleus sp. bin38.metabat.b11b12b14.051]|uniref:succinylglutamate desuccinylase/aspartoacylase domain-containing protein n=1 Tax=Microcoleus sp. bin38.metabat.b11b12b14.051 TaxID=2742709 RepID=UPI0025FA86E3|nr:succinylglutamate desuccinylase/aspartoacylase family protein [Microcoleus sp. bin38.metabat.b11b12b14.051]